MSRLSVRATVLRGVGVAALVAALAVTVRPLPAQQGSGASPAAATAMPPVPVAARHLARGTVLEEADISHPGVERHHGPARDASGVAPGWVTRRLIRAGEPLRPPAVAPAPLVTAGSAVRLVVRGEAFQMSVDGVAVVAASLGDTIPVRLGAKRRVRGVVTGPAQVVAVDSPRSQ